MASPAPAETINQLTVDDLAEVLQLLSRHDFSGVSYYTLGLYLGLSPATLDVITRNNKGDTESCLRECLTKWLQKADNVQKKGGPTISSLVSALRELGDNAVADGIDAKKHPACKILADYTSNKSLIDALPQLATFLHSEDLIKEMAHTEEEGKMLMSEIVRAVCFDPNKLEMFAAILIKKKVTMEIGNIIMRKYRKFYYCHESNDDLSKQDEIHLPPSLTSKLKSMRVHLGSTFDKVELIIGKCPPSILDKIKNILIYSSKDLKPQVAQCDNIHDILELVRKDCSLDDIEMLKAIVNELDLENAKVVVQEYSDAIEEFSKTELKSCLHERFSDASPLQCERITIVVDRNTDDCTLDDVRRLSANIFHKLSRRVKLNVIRDDNSFTITCSFPLVLSEQLITAALNNIDVLKENKVKRLTIGYCTVYEVNTPSTSTTTDSDEHQYTSSTSSGLMKQLMLSLSVQLINSKEENEELMKLKMTNFRKIENEISRQKSDETGQLLHKKDEALNVAQLTKQLPSVPSTQKVLVYTASGEPEAASALYFEDNKRIEQTLELAESNLQERMGQEMESIFQDERKDLGKKNDEEKQQIIALQKEREETKKKLVEKDTEIQALKAKLLSMKPLNPERQEYIAFEDDIYGFFKIDHPLLIKIVRTEQFTRLKEIKKLGYTYHNMPKATFSRYQQSIGMLYFAGKFVKTLRKNQSELNITDYDVLCVQIAALCCNLGFGPFSHIFSDFLKEIKASRNYWKGLPANVLMFQYMIEVNKLPFDEYFDNPEQDIEFIKELMTGRKGPQAELREDKVFLYEIVVNRMSGLDVNRMDYTMRDAVVLGNRINFKWRKFLTKVRVKVCTDGKKHICAKEEDLHTYKGFFTDRHTLFKELYFERKNRIVATMINRILIKCGDTGLIKGPDGKKLPLIDAIKSMDTYCRLNDSIIGVIKETVADPEVEKLIQFLGNSKLFIPIGYVKNCKLQRGAQQLKEEIVANEQGLSEDDIIVDVAESGYERATEEFMYYISSDGTVKQWTTEWQLPPADTFPAPWRVFYTKHNKELVAKMKSGLQKVIVETGGSVFLYDNETDIDLIPEEDPPAAQ